MYQAQVVPVDTEEGAREVYEVGRLATMAERARGDLDVVGEEGHDCKSWRNWIVPPT